MAESQLWRVADPAAGSGAFEALTSELAERSWQAFQDIEREGGIVASLQAGKFQSRIAASRDALNAELAAGRAPLVGSSVYRDPTAAEAIASEEHHAAPITSLAPIRLEAMTGLSA
jgi:methylmalonyl-CoA mutase